MSEAVPLKMARGHGSAQESFETGGFRVGQFLLQS